MMDELELLKKDWQKKDEHLPKLSYDEIHTMIWKKSSSIVKWIFYISIIEFIIPHLLYLIPSMRNSSLDIVENLGLGKVFLVVSIIQYLVVFYFIYQFYKRYREISVLDSAKKLTSKILRTRKTVKHYVFFSLSMVLVGFAIWVVGIYFSDNVIESLNLQGNFDGMSAEKVKFTIMAVFAVCGVLITALFGGIYFLLYGLLTRKLRKNFRELQKLEL
ncbi:hypothetical protein [Flagellimonas algicola]|uniref:Glycerophosphoryl diester phosphodiesterase family protein n=1 Tax=Flagellimonas algicola TaxID=2583815 RepID=A0ABY2WLY1_9FLAO|nr:hypothetical protein [Allomuricauda algicola]TMU56009.1 hypothetical protein FGG15_00250 [Allomuricauda algicola]